MSTSFLPYHFFLKIHLLSSSFSFFFFNDPATTEIYPLPLPAALPISLLSLVFAVGLGLSLSTTAMVARRIGEKDPKAAAVAGVQAIALGLAVSALERLRPRDRKSTRLNSSHDQISYAVFCLKKKTRLVDVARHDADLALPGRDDAGAVGADEPGGAPLEDALHAHHVEDGHALGDADDERQRRVGRLHDGVGGARGRDVDDRGVGSGRTHGGRHRVEDRDALEIGAAAAGRHARHHLRAVLAAEAGVELAGGTRDALGEDARRPGDEHAPCAAAATASRAPPSMS